MNTGKEKTRMTQKTTDLIKFKDDQIRLIEAELKAAKNNVAQLEQSEFNQALEAYWQGRLDGLKKFGSIVGLDPKLLGTEEDNEQA